MQIIQITTDVTSYDGEVESSVYGLGDDNRVYYWSPKKVEWVLFEKS